MTRKLMRPREGRMIGGVAAGLANYFGIDVTIVRVVWVLLLFPGGLPGFLPYLILWVIMPAEPQSPAP